MKIMRKTLILTLLLALLGATNLPAQTTFEEYEFVGDGTSANPIQIKNLLELLFFKQKVDAGHPSLCAKLVDIINMDEPIYDGTTTWYLEYWDGIGSLSQPYTGTFDGNGSRIINLKTEDWKSARGFIAYNAGTVMNLTVTGNVKGNENVGGIAGINTGTIAYCANYANISGKRCLGGIAGNNDGNIYQCENYGGVRSWSEGGTAGGIVGFQYYQTDPPHVKNCVNYGDVTAEHGIGGIIGEDSSGCVIIDHCVNHGTVTGERYNIAGIIGNSQNGAITVSNCTNRGEIKATGDNQSFVGGIAGSFNKGLITQCRNIGPINSTALNTGGIVGYSIGDIVGCKNTANVKGGQYVGGIVGYYYDGADRVMMKNCLVSSCTVSGSEKVAAVAGRGWCPMSENYYRNNVTVNCGGTIYDGDTERGTWINEWGHEPEWYIADLYEIEVYSVKAYNGAIMVGRIRANDNDRITVDGLPGDGEHGGGAEDGSDIVVKDGDRILTEGEDYTVAVDTTGETVTITFDGDYDGEIVVDYGTTGITALPTTERSTGSAIYTLDGRKVISLDGHQQFLPKGIYIKGGRKVVVR